MNTDMHGFVNVTEVKNFLNPARFFKQTETKN